MLLCAVILWIAIGSTGKPARKKPPEPPEQPKGPKLRFVKLSEIGPLPGTYIKDAPREDYVATFSGISNGTRILPRKEEADTGEGSGFSWVLLIPAAAGAAGLTYGGKFLYGKYKIKKECRIVSSERAELEYRNTRRAHFLPIALAG